MGSMMGGHHQTTMTESQDGVPVPSATQLDKWHDRATTSRQDCVEAAAWGADEQLRRCVEWIESEDLPNTAQRMQEAMRPKPPSLKEQALDSLDRLTADLAYHGEEHSFYSDIIRQAIESIPD
jgi:hypothetical protein